MEYKDYYAILGVDRKASDEVIKQSYRKLARKYHPDVSKELNAEEKFKNLQEAYEVLKDPEKRSQYDQLGSNWKSGQEFRPPPGWESAFQGGHGGHAGGFAEEADFSDFFSQMFGRAQGAGRASGGFHGVKHRGRDQQASINISLEDAYHGATKTLQLQMPQADASGRMHQNTRSLKVTIPKGASQGQLLRLAKQGAPGMGGAPAGDLYLEVNIEPHSLFSVEGHDVYLTLPVTPWEAALGAEIKVPTLGGVVGLKLAQGSQGGQKLRLKGRGMPGKTASGDQYAILQVLVPTATTPEQRQVYEKMAASMPFD